MTFDTDALLAKVIGGAGAALIVVVALLVIGWVADRANAGKRAARTAAQRFALVVYWAFVGAASVIGSGAILLVVNEAPLIRRMEGPALTLAGIIALLLYLFGRAVLFVALGAAGEPMPVREEQSSADQEVSPVSRGVDERIASLEARVESLEETLALREGRLDAQPWARSTPR